MDIENVKSEYYFARRFAIGYLTIKSILVKEHIAPIKLARTIGVYKFDGVNGARRSIVEWHYEAIKSCGIKKTNNIAGDFYSSSKWREVRYKALKMYGGKCKLCGVSGSHAVLHVDHIKPRSHYPNLALDLSNLQVLCEDCNLGKSNKDDTKW